MNPDTDLRDRIRRAAAALPVPEPEVESMLRRGHRRVVARLVGGAGATALLAAALAWGGLLLAGGLQPGGREVGGDPGAERYTDPTYGWTLSYPERFHAESFAEGTLHGTAEGLTVANFEVRLVPVQDGFHPLREFPPDGVAFNVWRVPGLAESVEDDARFPLSLADFDEIRPYVGGAEPAPRLLGFSGNGLGFAVAVWIGPEASGEDRAAVEQIVASLRFPPLESGTIIGGTFWVLDRADAYPVGSVTRFDESELPTDEASFREPTPFFLIHAPGGFYALNGVRLIRDGDPCEVEFDPAAFEFVCPLNGARWDLVGERLNPAAVPQPPYQGELVVYLTKIAHDGHVLVSPFYNLPGEAEGVWDELPGPVTYPRGAFGWCPDIEGTLPVGPELAGEAEETALRFVRAVSAGDRETERELLDPSVPEGERVGGEGVAVLGSGADGDLVEYACGPEVAARTWEVTIEDGTVSASLDFNLYLVRREDGWKVWGSY